MNCPNCGAPEKTRIRICPECDHAYTSRDLLELRQLEFLLEETDTWQVADTLLSPYRQRLGQLLELMHLAPESEAAQPEEPVEQVSKTTEQLRPFLETHTRTKVFRGPGTNFEQLGSAASGKRAAVLGVSRNRNWWQIKVPTSVAEDGLGWVNTYDVITHNVQDIPVIQAPSMEGAIPPDAIPAAAPPQPPKEKVPFDQWLLSERNIKIALYSGGLLLLIAGIIFIGVNWTRIPGPGKFAITLLITGLMYLGGYLLVQRPAYKIGGVALLGIAAGFFVLNFAVLQIYVMGPRGMTDNVMWLIASPFCLLLYLLTAYWTKSDLFTYFTIFALGSTITAALVLMGAAELIYLLVFSLLALVLRCAAHWLKGTRMEDFTRQPILILAHLIAPVTYLWSMIILFSGLGFLPLDTGNLWLSFAVLISGSTFYALDAFWNKRIVTTYISLLAIMISIAGFLFLVGAPVSAYLLIFASLTLIMVIISRWRLNSAPVSFIHQPLLILANIIMPCTYLAALSYLVASGNKENPWFTLIIFGMGAIFYLLCAFWRPNILYPYAAIGTVIGLVFGVFFLLEAALLVYPLVAACFALVCLVLARIIQDTASKDIFRFPLLSTSQVIMPLAIFVALAGWITHDLLVENPWLPLATLALAGIFYMLYDSLFKRLEARWAAAIIIPITLGLVYYELNLSMTFIAIASMVIAAAYLGIGYLLEQREQRRSAGWPLYATAYAISVLFTILAIPYTGDLIIILFADVLILVISALIHRVYWWVYGAVWLFMLPVYLLIDMYVPAYHYQGLLMGVLGLNYAAAGYFLGHRALRLGAPFLLAAAFLSLISIILTWSNPITATLVIAVSAALYFLAGLWLGWTWLHIPGLVLTNLIVLTVNVIIFGYDQPILHALGISYTALGVVYLLGGFVLRRSYHDRWSWPLYTLGTITIGGAYIASLTFMDWITIGISITTATLMFLFAWLERDLFTKLLKFPLLTYLGIMVVFIGHFLLLYLIFDESYLVGTGSIITAVLCAVFIALGWIFKREAIEEIYSIPLRWSGLVLMAAPMLGALVPSFFSFSDEYGNRIALTYGIAAVAFICDAIMNRSARESYLGIGSFLVAIWALLFGLEISEPQAYIIPAGVMILGIGGYEKKQGKFLLYKLLTYSGLILLMGSAFIQSIPRGAYIYAVLVGVEAIIAVLWGVRSRCRCFVQVGGIALIANAIVQLGPGFIDLPRWIQIGLTGAILLGGGMAALFRRDQIISTRRRLTDEWRQWNP